MRRLHKLERFLLIVGVLMLAFYAAAHIHRAVLSQADLESFKSKQLILAGEQRQAEMTAGTPNFSLWSEQRIKAYRESLASHFSPALGILRIARINVEVPILEGTDDLSLNRGVGHVAGTANPGESGNVAIAGHRDGFFRGLKDVSLGDMVEMVTPRGTETYVVDNITIVERTDISVLQSRGHSSLTLITCYPFYFIGSAPKRYIVQASVVHFVPGSVRASAQSDSNSGALVMTQEESF
jgi:sortase A